jgi:hypothetical protein
VVLASTATAQVAILQIQVIEGEGGIYAPGARSTRPLVVEITDETGRPVPGAAVSFHLPEDGPSGTFANGLRTEVVTTDDRGRAALRSMQLNRAPGRFQIRIIASKEQATAGIVSFQYIVDPAAGGVAAGAGTPRPAASSRPPSSSHGIWHKKWVLILAAVGLGAGAALAVAALHSHAASSSSSATPPVTTAVAPTVGTPTITVGQP